MLVEKYHKFRKEIWFITLYFVIVFSSGKYMHWTEREKNDFDNSHLAILGAIILFEQLRGEIKRWVLFLRFVEVES